jgi:hypothetical protein
MKTNYKILSDKIRSKGANLERLEKSIDNLYNNGILTVSELSRLDALIMAVKTNVPRETL